MTTKKIKMRAATKEQVRMAVAWASGKISYTQICQKLYGKNNDNGAYIHLARGLRQHLINNNLI